MKLREITGLGLLVPGGVLCGLYLALIVDLALNYRVPAGMEPPLIDPYSIGTLVYGSPGLLLVAVGLLLVLWPGAGQRERPTTTT